MRRGPLAFEGEVAPEPKRNLENGVVGQLARVVAAGRRDFVQAVLERVLVQEQLVGGMRDAAVVARVGVEGLLERVDLLVGGVAKDVADEVPWTWLTKCLASAAGMSERMMP